MNTEFTFQKDKIFETHFIMVEYISDLVNTLLVVLIYIKFYNTIKLIFQYNRLSTPRSIV